MAALLRALIKAYQLLVSPFTPPHCRYWPTCSEYALEAVRVHGALRGGWYALRRIARCHPWGGHGYDPVPEPAANTAHSTSHDKPVASNQRPGSPGSNDRDSTA